MGVPTINDFPAGKSVASVAEQNDRNIASSIQNLENGTNISENNGIFVVNYCQYVNSVNADIPKFWQPYTQQPQEPAFDDLNLFWDAGENAASTYSYLDLTYYAQIGLPREIWIKGSNKVRQNVTSSIGIQVVRYSSSVSFDNLAGPSLTQTEAPYGTVHVLDLTSKSPVDSWRYHAVRFNPNVGTSYGEEYKWDNYPIFVCVSLRLKKKATS
tara:strand:+ start:5211 stop:5849 length:639 start_codon:yes stop_codon:yes gene_type:complete